jgi:DNA-binding LytR/AlgR family response regulator
VTRLKDEVTRRRPAESDLAAVVQRVALALQQPGTSPHLQWIKASHRDGVRIVSVEEVCYFQAKDKYTAVVTAEGELLIKKPIKELATELDPDRFWQIHRGTVVNAGCIAEATRFLSGGLALRLNNRPETLVVSRAYAQRFKQM